MMNFASRWPDHLQNYEELAVMRPMRIAGALPLWGACRRRDNLTARDGRRDRGVWAPTV